MTLDDPRTPQDYLGHMLGAIDRIQRYVGDLNAASFKADEMRQDAVIRNLEVLGEAAEKLRRRFPEFVARHPEIPWRPAYGMRNVLSHGYFKVDLEVVWHTIKADLPALRQQLERVEGCQRPQEPL